MKTKQSYHLFLDDFRQPNEAICFGSKINYSAVDWVIVRNYGEFVSYIEKHGLPSIISFDHDLAYEHYGMKLNTNEYEEKTGYDCAKWLLEYCAKNKMDPPQYFLHSMNPEGRENIKSLFDTYGKMAKEDIDKAWDALMSFRKKSYSFKRLTFVISPEHWCFPLDLEIARWQDGMKLIISFLCFDVMIKINNKKYEEGTDKWLKLNKRLELRWFNRFCISLTPHLLLSIFDREIELAIFNFSINWIYKLDYKRGQHFSKNLQNDDTINC